MLDKMAASQRVRICSNRMKKPFAVLLISAIRIIVPMLVGVPDDFIHLYRVFQFLPTNMMEIWRLTSPIVYEIFNLVIPPYIFLPLFAVVGIIVSLPLIYGSSKK